MLFRKDRIKEVSGMQKISEISSQEWYQAFQDNAKRLLKVPWGSEYQLTRQERERVMASIQQFELGENSEGKTFRRKALSYAQRHDPEYMKALDLFIKEEQRHSATLRRFLQKSAEPTLQKHWVDSVFRRLRKLMDIEVEILVLLTAEIIAMVYYNCLQTATRSPVLIMICEQILRDETRHINFQSSSLYKIRQHQSVIRNTIMSCAHFMLLLSTTLLVWWQHHSVLSYAKASYFRFLREVMLVFRKSLLVSWGRI